MTQIDELKSNVEILQNEKAKLKISLSSKDKKLEQRDK